MSIYPDCGTPNWFDLAMRRVLDSGLVREHSDEEMSEAVAPMVKEILAAQEGAALWALLDHHGIASSVMNPEETTLS